MSDHITYVYVLTIFTTTSSTAVEEMLIFYCGVGGIKGRTTRQADTNVIAVKFNTLTEPSHMHTGDAVVCSNKDCMAILSHLSRLKQNTETGTKVIHLNCSNSLEY